MLLDYYKSRNKRSDIPLQKTTTEERRCVIEKREKTSEKQTSPDRAYVDGGILAYIGKQPT